MFCPKCGSEYREGFDRCADCGVALSVTPPPAPDHGGPGLAVLLETADVGFLPVLRSLLDGAGIPYIIQGEEAMGLLPIGALGSGPMQRALAAIVHVPEDRLEEARALLASGAGDASSGGAETGETIGDDDGEDDKA